jgi:hypothetical protein
MVVPGRIAAERAGPLESAPRRRGFGVSVDTEHDVRRLRVVLTPPEASMTHPAVARSHDC